MNQERAPSNQPAHPSPPTGAHAESAVAKAAPGAREPSADVSEKQGGRLRSVWIVALILAAGLAVRAALIANLHAAHFKDTDLFIAWAEGLFQRGLSDFYASIRFCNYPPLGVLQFWLIGGIGSLIEAGEPLMRVLQKCPANLADLLVAIVLWREARRRFGHELGIAAAALYWLNPAAIYNAAYWGQVDSIHTLWALLAVLLAGRGRTGWAGGFLALALLQKFQAIAIAPLVVYDLYRTHRWKGLLTAGLSFVAITLLVLAPFALHGVAGDVLKRGYVEVVGQYDELSKNAFNIWYALGGANIPDTSVPNRVAALVADGAPTVAVDASPLLWLTWRRIGLTIFAVAVAWILFVYSFRPSTTRRYAIAGLLVLAFFLFPTQMHERYALPALPFLSLWAVTGAWRERLYWLLTTLLLLNLAAVQGSHDIGMQIAGTILLVCGVVFIAALGRTTTSTRRELGAETVARDRFAWARVLRVATVVVTIALLAGCGLLLNTTYRAAKPAHESDAVYLSDLEPMVAEQGWGRLRRDRSVRGGVVRFGDTLYLKALGTHAPSTLQFAVPPGARRFEAIVGIDGATRGKGSAIVSVLGDGRTILRGTRIDADDEPLRVDVPVTDMRTITLRTEPTADGQSHDHVNWADARFRMESSGTSKGMALPADTVIARVNGDEILYRDIFSKVPSGYTPDEVAQNGTTGPSSAQDRQLAWDTRNLAAGILQLIREQQARRLGVMVTEADVDAYIEELKKESAKERNEGPSQMEIIVECLSEVYDDGRDPDAVYNERLRDRMPRSSWSSYLDQFKDPEWRQALAEEAANPEWDEEERAAVRRVLHARRLEEEIGKRLHARHPGRYRQGWKKVPIDSDHANENGVEYITVHLLDRDIYLWWQRVIEQTAIEFPLPAYAGALAEAKNRYDLGLHPTPDLDER